MGNPFQWGGSFYNFFMLYSIFCQFQRYFVCSLIIKLCLSKIGMTIPRNKLLAKKTKQLKCVPTTDELGQQVQNKNHGWISLRAATHSDKCDRLAC